MLLTRDEKPVRLWLAACALLVACMVMLGGYTRLSGSGLSITTWRPIHGTLPPMNEAQWNEEFEAYKASPQFQKVNSSMDMDDFRGIFWPEYLHRLLGRLVGLAFFGPFCIFLARRSLTRRFALRLVCIFALGGLQGLVGWLMVASGLVNMPRVSHFRLAAHLSIAFLIFALLLWAFLDIRPAPRAAHYPRKLLKIYQFWLAALCLQIVWGAFMAGLHAGYVYNTWPGFDGALLPPDLSSGAGFLADIATHIPAVQAIHRYLAIFLLLTVVVWWWQSRGALQKSLAGKRGIWLLIVINAQFALGVATLVQVVPLALAWLHQLVGLVLFGSALALLHALPRNKETVRT
ncbi:MAG: heme A synthase [Proteobacteria bacterium]|nr:heme A synthase [Pseudomonadota bacterium]